MMAVPYLHGTKSATRRAENHAALPVLCSLNIAGSGWQVPCLNGKDQSQSAAVKWHFQVLFGSWRQQNSLRGLLVSVAA
jgi:hypothetical protein